MRTLFFDIDGTLLITHRAGSGALEKAIGAEFDLPVIDMDINFGGSTDRYLVGEILKRNGLPTDDETQGRVRRRYASMLQGVLHKKGGERFAGCQRFSRSARGRSPRAICRDDRQLSRDRPNQARALPTGPIFFVDRRWRSGYRA